MSLQVSPVSRNLHNPVYLMGLEIEDMMIIGIVCIVALMGGQFLFPTATSYFFPSTGR
jgi:type IV secretory pathway TrbD component